MKRVAPVEVVVDDDGSVLGGPPGLRRLRKLAWLLDNSVSIGGGRRIGLDPLIGLIPGVGDWVGAGLSLYIVYEAARLGVPARIVAVMLGNVAMEATFGAIPIAGDLFDFAWKANARNLQLVERHYRASNAGRPIGRIVLFVLIAAALLLVALGALVFNLVVWLWRAIT